MEELLLKYKNFLNEYVEKFINLNVMSDDFYPLKTKIEVISMFIKDIEQLNPPKKEIKTAKIVAH